MKRIGVVLLVMAMGLVIASPAGAAKPIKPDKPDKGPNPSLVAVSLSAEPVWVHEGADVIRYTVTVENKTNDTMNVVTVEFTAANTTDTATVGDISPDQIKESAFTRTMSEFDESISCGYGDECPLPATATVFVNGSVLTQATMSTPLMPYPSCGFEYGFVNDDFVSNSVLVSDMCIWTLPIDGDRTGVWEITLYPTLPDKPKRNLTAGVSVRDHVPGNWCPLAVDASWGFGERWPFDVPIIGEVYLPGDEDSSGQDLGNGVCLAGGAGGDYFAVGNPDSFYLRANGDVTVRWDRPRP